MKNGDRVQVISGCYKGAKGTVVGVWGTAISVEPNENADVRILNIKDLKVITEKQYVSRRRKDK